MPLKKLHNFDLYDSLNLTLFGKEYYDFEGDLFVKEPELLNAKATIFYVIETVKCIFIINFNY